MAVVCTVMVVVGLSHQTKFFVWTRLVIYAQNTMAVDTGTTALGHHTGAEMIADKSHTTGCQTVCCRI